MSITTPTRRTNSEPNRWAVLALLGVAQLMVVLDATIVNIALPSAQRALHFSTDSRQWVVTAYALAFGSLLLLGGKLGDLFGRKWTLIGGLTGFAVASAIGGLAQSFGMLVAARALQGAFGALLAPSALGLLTVTFQGSADRAKALKQAGVQRVHHNVETAASYYPEVSTTVRYEGRLRTIDAVREAGLETCVGGILNLGETREQRVEMAFQLAGINPTSVPINLLNPRPGTKFGNRELMDPWETVKWIAIFRLILPEALFRLCGGRVENLGELQATAVRAGLNGVMMGNFLTTLGNTPEQDRAMFEELGLNVARQTDNGANPRPDNRSGWLDGETPDVVGEAIAAHEGIDMVSFTGSTRAGRRVSEVAAANVKKVARTPGTTSGPLSSATCGPRW